MCLSIDDTIDIAAASLASGLAIEASSYPKPGNVSPMGDAKNLTHWFFIATSASMAIELERLIREAVYGDSICPKEGIGEKIYRLYIRSSSMQGSRNTHLGFTILITPIAFAVGLLIKESGEAGSMEVEEILDLSYEIARTCGSPDDFRWISKAILEASPSYILKYIGEGPDIYSADKTRATFWDFIEAFKRHDLLLNEIWSGYPRAYLSSRIICEGYPWKLYEKISMAYISIGSSAIDTVIAREKGYKVALDVMNTFRKALAIISSDSKLWLKYLEILDRELRSSGINPGSIADIVAVGASLCIIEKALNPR
ncbi:MAG: triphosphoribosyl-dephospho-CoA synthase [Sulfolobales archaeon]